MPGGAEALGTWGIGAFENDDALDWVSDLTASEGWPPVEEALQDGELGQSGAPVCVRALAAAELVAFGRGHPVAHLPESASRWIASVGPPPDELAARARATVESVRAASELRELFRESGELRSWSAELRRLTVRLAKEPRKLEARHAPVPATPEDLLKRATREVSAGRCEEAVATCNAILALDGDPIPALQIRAWCLAKLGTIAEASADIERAIALMDRGDVPDRLKAACHRTRGFVLLQARSYDEAIREFARSLELFPTATDLELRALVYEALGRTDLAAEDRRSLRALRTEDDLRQARAFYGNTQYRQALIQLDRIIEREPGHAIALCLRALTILTLGDKTLRNQAERDLSKAIEVDPENCYLHYERAVVRALLGEKAAAREDRVRCHELGFDLIAFYVNHLNLEKQTMARGNPVVVKREVIPHLTSYLKIIPEHVGMLELRAQAFQMVGEPDKAARDRRRLHQVSPLPIPAPGQRERGWQHWYWKIAKGRSLN